MRIDLDKLRRTARQDLTFAIANLGGPVMFAAMDPHLPSFDNKRFEQGHGLYVRHCHRACQGDQIVQLVHLAHGFIKDGGDDAAVRVRRRSDKTPLQTKTADKALTFLVENKLQLQSGLIARAATKAMVGELLRLYLVAGNSFVTEHVLRMRQS